MLSPLAQARTAPVQAGAAATPKLLVDGLTKRYGAITALEPTRLEVPAGEFLTLLGPSGSGKTTLLQMICGLVEPSGGRILIDGQDETRTPVHKRDIGLVFQHYALFPHLTVAENIGFPLRMRGVAPADLARRVKEALEMVHLGHLAARFPKELSGGQQQRVALARCFVYQPSVILMDEPLGALDKKLREHMQYEIKRLHRETGATIIYVTHDQEEALAMSDRICLMNHARIEQLGTPHDIYARPKTAFAADFIGVSNIFRGPVRRDGNGTPMLVTGNGSFRLSADTPESQDGALVVRPEQLDIDGEGDNEVRGEVVDTVYAGSETRVLVSLGGEETITVRLRRGTAPPRLGEVVAVRWRADAGVLVS
ncbi:polyamine ABC transporter ATP-binding protein (plasmid) [Azospirillum sp. TSH58]|uniref:ABC transporter ATP-binding protein n=1 Tax=Azospirillum sp. TSH58 TaxID=664962 RepID=UPI000D600F15|nr:ABC transporter ATP-binding protein [Azospirillum sp. TSH58]AWJ82279.1 polyamine ABC transporter ATP-binding protein [Azospirillum sp. TSH58]PWC72989.1 ABC transporter [Azospirillum sp. TSH58]